MITGTWTLKADSASQAEVVKWLGEEALHGYVLVNQPGELEVDFYDIDDAFRFRMRFDGELLS